LPQLQALLSKEEMLVTDLEKKQGNQNITWLPHVQGL
jgi:hypothetical protein